MAQQTGVLLGVFSFGVGIYALDEWVARRIYLGVKKRSRLGWHDQRAAFTFSCGNITTSSGGLSS